uniref:Uncharacterized protein n=1 Tax=Magallana gigas TaxID=29159 RepID=A0A8W8NC25_MAGGI
MSIDSGSQFSIQNDSDSENENLFGKQFKYSGSGVSQQGQLCKNQCMRPSEIHFSGDSIRRAFGSKTRHSNKLIGETLDDILTGEIDINSIPCISVCNRNGYWFTPDNKRLWVFQQAEKRGKCSKIYVRSTSCIYVRKFTTINNGLNVRFRGDPGGSIWRRM